MGIQRIAVAAMLAVTALPTSAGIIFQHGAPDSMAYYSSGATTMPTLVMAPNVAIAPQFSYQVQRARAWANYRRGDHAGGGALVFSPVFAGSYGQFVARTQLSRANAYRMGYRR